MSVKLLITIAVTAITVLASCSSDKLKPPVTSGDGITECNLIHNINACYEAGKPPDNIPVEHWALAAMAYAELGKRFNLDPRQIKISSVEKVDWPDSSLGNPQPGEVYAQVVTPGYKIILSVGPTKHIFHTSQNKIIYVSQSP